MFGNFLSESCTGTTGTITLTGARPGHIPYSEKYSDLDQIFYVIEDGDGIKKCGGVGVYSGDPASFSRTDSWTWDGTTYDDSPSGNLTLTGNTHITRITPLSQHMDAWDAHSQNTANPHSTSIGNLVGGTFAQLNTKVLNATLAKLGDNISSFTNNLGYITSVTQGDVTAHQSALQITESQITDLNHLEWADPVTTNLLPSVTNTHNLGSSSVRWDTLYSREISVTNTITASMFSGTDLDIDGGDVALPDGETAWASGATILMDGCTISMRGSTVDFGSTTTLSGDMIPAIGGKMGDIGSATNVWGAMFVSTANFVDVNVTNDILPTVTNTSYLGNSGLVWLSAHVRNLTCPGTFNLTGFGFGTNAWPNTNNSRDLGTSSLKWRHAYISGNIIVDGTVDGRDIAADGATLDALGGGGEPTENIILDATKTAGQNINGTEGSEDNLTWNVVSQDTGELTSFSSGGSLVRFTNAGWVNIHASAYISNSLMNNRFMMSLSIYHHASNNTLKYSYHGDMQYNRDDNNAYDASGGSVNQNMMYVAAGDYIYIKTRVFDDGTAATTQTLDTTYSKLRIARIEF